MRLRLRVNPAVHELEANPNRTVLSIWREALRLPGTKQGCAVGVCGLCSVLLDGQLTSACLLLAPMVDGRALTTIEGIGPRDGLNQLQQAFIDHAGFQCGICTPGQIVAATALLAEQRAPSADEIRRWMMGNLCRCTGYHGIAESIQAAAIGTAAAPSDGERVDGAGKVSGSANYAADLSRPGMLWARTLRSPYPHARIVSIDSSRARALPGVHAVLTGADLPPGPRAGRNMRDMPVLAVDKGRFVRETVAAAA